jgi:hypothetical protein
MELILKQPDSIDVGAQMNITGYVFAKEKYQ